MNVSYFEIGGEIIECHGSTSIPSSLYSPSLFRGAPTTPTVPQVQAERNNEGAGGRKGEQTTLAYTPYSYGSPLVWAASQVLMRIAQRDNKPGVDPITGEPNLY